jgi:myo-inositol-1(or 4)-monophosphatase
MRESEMKGVSNNYLKAARRQKIDPGKAQAAAVRAARAVGALLKRNLHSAKRANEVTQHDIKLELDVRSQQLIEKTLRSTLPGIPLLGEEGSSGDVTAAHRWVVDPIDGTVNFTYGIPHACVSIALQQRREKPGAAEYGDGYETTLGVIYDPFCDELWTARSGQPARLNGKTIHVSARRKLDESIVCLGFAKTRESLERTLPYFNELVPRVRKIRIMGSAALALTYVATGRFDAYIESGIRLWDVAAGGLIVQRAGGDYWHRPIAGEHAYRLIASNGWLRRSLRVP